MNPFQRLTQAVRHALQLFFARDLSLRRGERGVELVLVERSTGGQPATKLSRDQLQQRKLQTELALMQQQLAAVLDELPETRATLRHLVFVEQALARKGWRALHKLPLDVLQRALEQLEGLVLNWSPEGLANLRSKMAVAIIEREQLTPGADAYRTAMPVDLAAQAEAEPLQATPRSGAELADGVLVSDADGDALAAAYAAYAPGMPVATHTAAGASAPVAARVSPDLTPAELATAALDRMQAGAPLEYHLELGSPSAQAQTRAQTQSQARSPALAGGPASAVPITLRELEG